MKQSLVELGVGKKAKIVALEGGIEFQKKLASLNIRIGKKIEKIAVHPLSGPVVIRINNRRVTLGRGMASKIFVVVE